jgi:hypothetical protein
MARISIIVEDNAVYKDNVSIEGLDLSTCNIPSNVWALQWDGSTGHIELDDSSNQDITELPEWANAAVSLFDNYPEPEDEPEPDYSNEMFWNNYKEAHMNDIESLLNQSHSGINIDVCYKHYDVAKIPVGIQVTYVAEGASGLSGLSTFVSKAEALGLSLFSDRGYTYNKNFATWLSDNGWSIYEDENQNYNIAFRPFTLELAKLRKKRWVNYERDEQINNGYNDGNHTWDIDNNSMTNMNAKLLVTEDTDSITWRSKLNTNITMTGAEFKSLVKDCVSAVNAIYQSSWTRKANIDAATSIDDIDSL